MEKETTLSIYRNYKSLFDEKDLAEIANELTKMFSKTIKIVSIGDFDGEYLKVIIGNN